jgi:hypothetical protein
MLPTEHLCTVVFVLVVSAVGCGPARVMQPAAPCVSATQTTSALAPAETVEPAPVSAPRPARPVGLTAVRGLTAAPVAGAVANDGAGALNSAWTEPVP